MRNKLLSWLNIGSYPWEGKESIYSVLHKVADANNGNVPVNFELPDEEKVVEKLQLKWMHGSLDGVFAHTSSPKKESPLLDQVVNLCVKLSKSDNNRSKAQLYNLLVENSTIEIIDPLAERLGQREVKKEPYLHNLAKWLVKTSSDREPLKLGIALLGLIGDQNDLEDIVFFSKIGEFSLFGIVAIVNITPDFENVLFEIAKEFTGWEKIHIVERLINTKNPKIKDWMLRDGFRNNVMDEYLAYTCAVGGDLRQVLEKDQIETGLLTSIADLMQALIMGGPAKDIRDYEDSYYVIRDFIKHFKKIARDELGYFLRMNQIYRYLNDEDNFKDKESIGWTSHNRRLLIQDVQSVVEDPKWKKILNENLDTKDTNEVFNLNAAASILSVDIWESNWKRLIENPDIQLAWYFVLTGNYNENNLNEDRIDKILELAREKLDLQSVALGPADDNGLGTSDKLNNILDDILIALIKFPGKGLDMIKLGLKSPIIRNRNMAINALENWDQRIWNEDLNEMLNESLKAEVVDDVRSKIQELINSKK